MKETVIEKENSIPNKVKDGTKSEICAKKIWAVNIARQNMKHMSL